MNSNLALSRLADRVQPDEAGMLWVRDHLAALEIRVIKAFPRSRLVPIGSYSRGTAIAVHSNVDTLAVLPREWATWGARRAALDAQTRGENASARRQWKALFKRRL